MSEEIRFKPVNVRPEVHEELKQFCDEHGFTLSGIAEKGIKKYMLELTRIFDLTSTGW